MDKKRDKKTDFQVLENNNIYDYDDDIKQAVQEWLDQERIENKIDVGQSRFKALCSYIYQQVIKKNKYILHYELERQSSYYDLEKVNKCLEYFYNLCSEFNIVLRINNFSMFSGINRDTINEWKNANKNKTLSPSHTDLYRKIHEYFAESLEDVTMSCTGNPTKYIVIGNAKLGWSAQTTQKEEQARQLIQRSTAAIPEKASQQNSLLSLPDGQ